MICNNTGFEDIIQSLISEAQCQLRLTERQIADKFIYVWIQKEWGKEKNKIKHFVFWEQNCYQSRNIRVGANAKGIQQKCNGMVVVIDNLVIGIIL